MPSDAFIGMLSGLGDAHRARQKNIFDQEVARREQMAKTFEKLAEHPSITPEGAEQYYKQAFGIRTLDINKKVPKEWESLATEVAPKFGQSWLGGQTTNKVEATNMPIASELPKPGMDTSLGSVQAGKVPSLEAGQTQPSTRTPPPSQYEAPMPQPPPGVQRSAFYSPQEISRQKMAAAVEMLQALGPIQQQQALETERAKLAMQPDEAFPFSEEAGLATRSGRVIREPVHQPEKPPAQPAVRTVTTEQGVYVLNPDGSLGNRLGDRPRPTASAPTLSPYGESNILNRLTQQWDKAAGDVTDLNRANAIMESGLNAARRGDMNAGAQAVLITFQKFLDPTSVVRESEYARSSQGLSIMERVKGYVERLAKGGAGVTLPELETFAQLARDINNNLASESTSLLAKQKERISRVAERYNIPPDLVFSGYDFSKGGGAAPTPSPSAGSGAGAVIEGEKGPDGKPRLKAR